MKTVYGITQHRTHWQRDTALAGCNALIDQWPTLEPPLWDRTHLEHRTWTFIFKWSRYAMPGANWYQGGRHGSPLQSMERTSAEIAAHLGTPVENIALALVLVDRQARSHWTQNQDHDALVVGFNP